MFYGFSLFKNVEKLEIRVIRLSKTLWFLDPAVKKIVQKCIFTILFRFSNPQIALRFDPRYNKRVYTCCHAQSQPLHITYVFCVVSIYFFRKLPRPHPMCNPCIESQLAFSSVPNPTLSSCSSTLRIAPLAPSHDEVFCTCSWEGKTQ